MHSWKIDMDFISFGMGNINKWYIYNFCLFCNLSSRGTTAQFQSHQVQNKDSIQENYSIYWNRVTEPWHCIKCRHQINWTSKSIQRDLIFSFFYIVFQSSTRNTILIMEKTGEVFLKIFFYNKEAYTWNSVTRRWIMQYTAPVL